MSRSIDDFLTDLDEVLATSTAPDAPSATAVEHDTETRHDAATGRQDTTPVEDRTRQDTRDTETGRDATPRVVQLPRRSGRLPDWWSGPRPLDLSTTSDATRQQDSGTTRPGAKTGNDETDGTDSATPDQDTVEEPEEPDTRSWYQYVRDELRAGRSGHRSSEKVQDKDKDQPEDADESENKDKDPDKDPDKEKSEAPDEDQAPGWDPTTVAGRVLDSHRARPVHQRAATATKDAVAAVTAPRASTGRLLFAASSIGASWWIGLTPWLIENLDGAPIGVSIALVVVGWSIHRAAASAAAPVRWCAHSLYTCCVIAAFLHS